MTIAFGAIGAKSAGSAATTVAVAYPASVGAGDSLILAAAGWYDTATVTAISGWTHTEQAAGTGTAVDNHSTLMAAFHKVADGGETGTVTVTRSVTPNGHLGVMARYTKTDSAWAAPVTASGADSVHEANRSVTTGTIDLAPGDMLVVAATSDTDTTLAGFSAPTLTASGITFGTVTRRTSGTGVSSGNDGNVELFDAVVTAGTGTVAVTFAFTTSTVQCGPVVITRLREVSGTAHTGSPADAVGVTDGTDSVVAAVRAPADPVGVTDAATRVVTADRTQGDPVGVTDSVAAALSRVVTVADFLSLTDTATGETVGAGGASVNDPVGVSDAATVAFETVRTTLDDVALSDTITAQLARSVTVTDLVGATDAASAVLTPAGAPARDLIVLAGPMLARTVAARTIAGAVTGPTSVARLAPGPISTRTVAAHTLTGTSAGPTTD